MSDKLIEIKNLKTYFYTEAGTAKAVNDVSFDVMKGEVLGIVGESGSGKSVTSLSINRLIPNPPGEIVSGEILYNKNFDINDKRMIGQKIPFDIEYEKELETDSGTIEKEKVVIKEGTIINPGILKELIALDDMQELKIPVNLLDLSFDGIREFRGRDIAMIFQEPMTSLNPVLTIGYQMNEVLIKHEQLTKEEATEKSIQMLELVGIPDPKNRMNEYPHQFSGGMRQRVMIAMALQCNPALLIADEPTTALDVTIQAQILDLMLDLKNKRTDSAILLITHDLAVVAETCDRVIVMYGGEIQEIATVSELFKNPLHPYTQALMDSIPQMESTTNRLKALKGMVPSIIDMDDGCKFCNRFDGKDCPCYGTKENQKLIEASPGHFVRCHEKIIK